MTPPNEIKPAAPAEALDGGRCAVDAGFGFNVYRQWGTKHWKSVKTEREAWAAIGRLRFGEGYEVRDNAGHVRPEFITF